MIKLIKFLSYLGGVWANPSMIAAIDFQDNDAYVRVGDTDYRVSHETARALIAELEGDKPQVAIDELILTMLVSAQRDETSNNARPMWRCKTDDGEKVNIFLNTDDEKKDSFHLFEQAGWGEELQSIGLHEIRKVSIQIAMKKNGQFWEVRIVRLKPLSDMPDWAREPYLFDEIVTGDWNQEGGES